MALQKKESISISYVERLNAATHFHVKRLSRLTLTFSEKCAITIRRVAIRHMVLVLYALVSKWR